MAKHTVDSTRPEDRPGITREDYAAFIAQIELLDVWLQEARVVNYYGPRLPAQGGFRIDSEVGWEAHPGGFRALNRDRVVLCTDDETYAEIEVTFALDFASRESMTDEIFTWFGEVNLPVNTWPYLREFVSTALGRMGWPPFTLPALKRNISPATHQLPMGRARQTRQASTSAVTRRRGAAANGKRQRSSTP